MAFTGQQPLKLIGAKAGAGLTLATVQYKFVKMAPGVDNTVVLCSAASDRPVGVIQAPVQQTGDPVDVVVIGQTKLQADVALAAGYGVGTSSDGQAAHVEGFTYGTSYLAGMVVDVSGGTSAGNLITAVVNCVNMPFAA
jgi:hypothetical protein